MVIIVDYPVVAFYHNWKADYHNPGLIQNCFLQVLTDGETKCFPSKSREAPVS